ncbi:isoaspartyl peptidase/L-asparaginase isoform X2 [Hydra vulgaris]|uniref:L-asparaginase n=2 Tax=Hydra vulgaris TaxID=6087 RepID=T2MAA6_HYDVU|nr:isoaspartyl peptidase/L-asparaginase isoform X1 [Hydra vulgaris]
MEPCIIVHGGAFNIPESYVTRYKEGTKAAAKFGYDILHKGGTAVDAVEAAVNQLENNSAFNAGHGSVLTAAGTVEMDAIIVDGKLLKTGAVGCVENIANPVSLARQVMEKTSHCLLVGAGAMKFAKDLNFELLSTQELITKDSVCKSFCMGEGTFDKHIELYMNKIIKANDINDLEACFKEMMKKEKLSESGHDTVGAVAIDIKGNIACATSTGGMPGKMLGRVGDSPIFGSGAYANTEGGCSSTGHGESLMKTIVCREAVRYLEDGFTAMEASEKAISLVLQQTGGRGGIILIDKKGNVGYAFNTGCMAWASFSSKCFAHGLRTGEHFVEPM